jgi:hypothetical protein
MKIVEASSRTSETSTPKSGDHSIESSQLGFWRWFLRGGRGRGWRKFADRWLLLHLTVGLVLAYLVPAGLSSAATTVLLPLVGILIGLSFAWAGNAQALLQTEEIEQLADYRPGGFEEYVFTYQAAILTILSSVVLWGVAALGIFDLPCPWSCPTYVYFATKVALYAFSSITIRECWHVVLGAQMMLLMRRRIRRTPRDSS